MPVEPSQPDLADQAPAAAEPDQTPAAAEPQQAPPAADDAPQDSGDEGSQAAGDEPPEPAETAETAEPADGEAPQPAATGGNASRRLRLPIALGVVTVLLGGFGALATVQAHNQRAANAQQNLALTDGAATSAVRNQVSSAIQAIFSYSYTDTARTRRDAQSLLTGPAIRQYDQLFSLVQKDAPAQKLVVTTSVTNAGVEFLTGSLARVLIFANQQDSRAGTGQTSYAGAMFAVIAVRTGGTWKISDIDTFTGG
jgi:Mce-associated membrane protein